MRRFAILSLSLPFSFLGVQAASADAPDKQPDDDFTIGLVTAATDLALGFEFRATEHFAWGFDIGASFIDKAGLSLGVGAKYFPADDFRGFYIGFDGSFAALSDASFENGISARSVIGAVFGRKWIIGPGFTIDLNIGPGLAYAEDVDTDTDTSVVTRPLSPTLIGNATLGWSF